jgi:hypothetical protein
VAYTKHSMNALKIGLALAGFLVALVSVALDNRRIAWGAIALLIGSLICRILIRKRESAESGLDP